MSTGAPDPDRHPVITPPGTLAAISRLLAGADMAAPPPFREA
jgi:hypothetical protein